MNYYRFGERVQKVYIQNNKIILTLFNTSTIAYIRKRIYFYRVIQKQNCLIKKLRKMKTLENKTIVAFHVGRGGRFNNPGHKNFVGEKKIGDFVENLFLNYENQSDLFRKIEGRKNLEKKYYECCDSDDFTWFTNKGFTLGEKIYTDCDGNPVGLTEKEEERGIGCINIDHQYDTTYTKYLGECDHEEMLLIEKSGEWNKIQLIEKFFSERHCDFDWCKFNGNYRGIIDDYFNFGKIDFEDFFKKTEE